MTKHEWSRDDANALSLSFDSALARGAVDEIERLSHMWLLSQPPQVIELGSGRRVSDDLVSTVEQRVIQLRRADDYITGATSHDLMRNELAATVELISEAALSEDQARRLLVSVGEMAQLGAWVAADTGELDQAARYVRGGVMAARAGHDYALAGNIISTFSYQVANNANPNDAAVLAQTAYQGGRKDATPVTRALLLERVAWAAARSGDLRSCERTLGLVEDSFAAGPRDNDPDWGLLAKPRRNPRDGGPVLHRTRQASTSGKTPDRCDRSIRPNANPRELALPELARRGLRAARRSRARRRHGYADGDPGGANELGTGRHAA